jgi:hypothetical protein
MNTTLSQLPTNHCVQFCVYLFPSLIFNLVRQSPLSLWQTCQHSVQPPTTVICQELKNPWASKQSTAQRTVSCSPASSYREQKCITAFPLWMLHVCNMAWPHCIRITHWCLFWYIKFPRLTTEVLTRSCSSRANSLSWASIAISLSWSNMSNCWDPSCSCRRRANSYGKTAPNCIIYWDTKNKCKVFLCLAQHHTIKTYLLN